MGGGHSGGGQFFGGGHVTGSGGGGHYAGVAGGHFAGSGGHYSAPHFAVAATGAAAHAPVHGGFPTMSANHSAGRFAPGSGGWNGWRGWGGGYWRGAFRSEEHTSELQAQSNIVCRL